MEFFFFFFLSILFEFKFFWDRLNCNHCNEIRTSKHKHMAKHPKWNGLAHVHSSYRANIIGKNILRNRTQMIQLRPLGKIGGKSIRIVKKKKTMFYGEKNRYEI